MVAAGQRHKEVTEEDAQPPIKGIYEDIKATLHVPSIPQVFRVLAAYPDYLQLAWRQLQPNAQTISFQRQAREIGARAAETAEALGSPRPPDDSGIVSILKTFQDLNPKVFLAVAALRAATGGQIPRLQNLPLSEKRQVPKRIPADSPAVPLLVPEDASDRLRRLFDQIADALAPETAGPAVPDDFRVLATFPDYLDTAWESLKGPIGTKDFRESAGGLEREANEALLSMPFRIEINPHTLRLVGLSEAQIDEVKTILDGFYHSLPRLILTSALLTLETPTGYVGA